MADAAENETLRKISELLDDRVPMAEDDDRPLYDRVLDVVVSFESWSDLAVKRLHEIHRLSDQECDYCPKWLDEG